MKQLFFLAFFLLGLPSLSAQEGELVQVSGVVLSADSLDAVWYCNIGIYGSHRGTISDLEGFFSLVVQKGDTVAFSAVGFERSYLVVPDTLDRDSYSVIHLMKTDTILLPESVIFPWPSQREFPTHFMALEIDDDDIARFQKGFGPMPALDYIPRMTDNSVGASVVISGPFTALVNFIKGAETRKLDRYRDRLGILDSIREEQKVLREE
ncbi:carboxypeptidase-like regulatory domain-containing protein [Chitinophagales bacterium]|nr:carboxypeptidase-like regulatory domain-containing protein [Chitinophagales bacterium]